MSPSRPPMTSTSLTKWKNNRIVSYASLNSPSSNLKEHTLYAKSVVRKKKSLFISVKNVSENTILILIYTFIKKMKRRQEEFWRRIVKKRDRAKSIRCRAIPSKKLRKARLKPEKDKVSIFSANWRRWPKKSLRGSMSCWRKKDRTTLDHVSFTCRWWWIIIFDLSRCLKPKREPIFRAIPLLDHQMIMHPIFYQPFQAQSSIYQIAS